MLQIIVLFRVVTWLQQKQSNIGQKCQSHVEHLGFNQCVPSVQCHYLVALVMLNLFFKQCLIRAHSVEIKGFFFYLDFTWKHFLQIQRLQRLLFWLFSRKIWIAENYFKFYNVIEQDVTKKVVIMKWISDSIILDQKVAQNFSQFWPLMLKSDKLILLKIPQRIFCWAFSTTAFKFF